MRVKSRRMNSLTNLVQSPKSDPEIVAKIQKDLTTTRYLHFGTLATQIAILTLLARKGFFNTRSAYFWRETSVVAGLIAADVLADIQISEWLWDRHKESVKAFAREREKEFFALRDTAEATYQKQKEEQLYQ